MLLTYFRNVQGRRDRIKSIKSWLHGREKRQGISKLQLSGALSPEKIHEATNQFDQRKEFWPNLGQQSAW